MNRYMIHRWKGEILREFTGMELEEIKTRIRQDHPEILEDPNLRRLGLHALASMLRDRCVEES